MNVAVALIVTFRLLCTTSAEEKCEKLSDPVCFSGASPVTYNFTSISLVGDSQSQTDVKNNLARWSGLQSFPTCWSAAAPFLCRLYKPPCDVKTGEIELPCRQSCEKAKTLCTVVESYGGWPNFTDCQLFPSCDNRTQTAEINVTSNASCVCPLLRAHDRNHWFRDLEGCGLQCNNPMFDAWEHRTVRTAVAVLGSICFFCTFFTLLTFLIDWKRQSHYPSVIIFYMNSCFCVGSIAWLSQFFGNTREAYICRSDNTARLLAPTEASDAACVVVFAFIYYFMMATVLWFVMLAFAWDFSFQSLNMPGDPLAGKARYFHLIAWSLPAIKTIIIIALREVDGNSLSGICFVGYEHLVMRAYFVVGPLGIYLYVGGTFLLRGLIRLCKLNSSKVTSVAGSSSKLLKATIVRIGIFAFLVFAFSLVTFACHLFDYRKQPQWEDDFTHFISCKSQLNSSLTCSFDDDDDAEDGCVLNSKPSVNMIVLQLCAMFLCGVAISMWAITPATPKAWKRFFKRSKRRVTSFELSRFARISRAIVAPAPTVITVPVQMTHSCTATATTDSGVNMDEGSLFTVVNKSHPVGPSTSASSLQ